MTEQTTPSPPAPALVVPEPLQLLEQDMSAYNALRTGVVYFDIAPVHISSFSGPGAMGALNGLVTNDVSKLDTGRGMYAAALTPKGKLLADVVLLRTEPETFLVYTSATAGAEWFSMVRKYVNPRLASYRNESDALTPVGVYGARAALTVARLGGATGGGAMLTDALAEALHAWGAWTHSLWKLSVSASGDLSTVDARLIRAPYLGDTEGFVLLVQPNAVDALRTQLEKLGAMAGNSRVWSIAALESGRPVFGLDMDATTLPQEANLDAWSAISFDKGCYTGQETVARIHFRGHVNKHLRGLHSSSPLPIGAMLNDESGKAIGDVRRSGVSPASGAFAIGMIRRELIEGATVTTEVDGSIVSATVFNLVRPTKSD